MKTTQLTSKVLVASMLLTLVSPVLAVETPAFVKTAWEKTQNAGKAAWAKTKSAGNATGKFFMPTHPTDAEKMSDLIKCGVVAPKVDVVALETNIADLNAHLVEVNADATLSDEARAVEVGRLEALIANTENELSAAYAPVQKSFFKRNVADKFNTLNINHPNYVKYGAMSAVAAAITAAGFACYKYELPQKGFAQIKKAYNKIKSLFGFGKTALDAITAQAEKLANGNVEGTLAATLEIPAIKTAVASLKTSKAELEKAVKTFDANVKTKTAVDVALSNVKLAVEEANKELATQEASAKAETAKSEATTTTEEQKKEQPATSVKAKAAPVRKCTTTCKKS